MFSCIFGVAWSIAATLFQVLQQARHKIKTVYGVSDPVYGSNASSLAGSGQGNGLGPALCALISSIIVKTCKAKSHSMIVLTAFSKQDISLLGFAFVDDADLILGADDVYTSGVGKQTAFV